MADNYLEKRYEQYEKRKREWERRCKLGIDKSYPKTNTKIIKTDEDDKNKIIQNDK